MIISGETVDYFASYLKQIVRELKHTILSLYEDAQKYFLNDGRRAGRPITLLFGVLDYLSTHCFDLEGIERINEANLLASLRR